MGDCPVTIGIGAKVVGHARSVAFQMLDWNAAISPAADRPDIEGKVSLCGRGMRLDLDVHGGVSFSDQWPMETGPPSLTLRRVSASGTAASEISISTQKASM